MTMLTSVEHSDLSGEIEDDGVTVQVDIFRAVGRQGGWLLEVTSEEGDITRWDEPFASDEDAWAEFLATAARDGIRSLHCHENETLH